MKFKIVSICDQGDKEKCLNDTEGYKKGLSLNEARRQLEHIAHGCEFCSGLILKVTSSSATVLFEDGVFPYTFKIEIEN
jgi:hypothetical protein